jgi:chemotaxis response regulator CheB
MPVREVEEGMALKPNQGVLIPPPGVHMTTMGKIVSPENQSSTWIANCLDCSASSYAS